MYICSTHGVDPWSIYHFIGARHASSQAIFVTQLNARAIKLPEIAPGLKLQLQRDKNCIEMRNKNRLCTGL